MRKSNALGLALLAPLLLAAECGGSDSWEKENCYDSRFRPKADVEDRPCISHASPTPSPIATAGCRVEFTRITDPDGSEILIPEKVTCED